MKEVLFLTHVPEVRRRKLLSKVSSYDHISALKRIRKKRHSTTSSWFTKSREFKNWFEDSKTSILLLTGIRMIFRLLLVDTAANTKKLDQESQ